MEQERTTKLLIKSSPLLNSLLQQRRLLPNLLLVHKKRNFVLTEVLLEGPDRTVNLHRARPLNTRDIINYEG